MPSLSATGETDATRSASRMRRGVLLLTVVLVVGTVGYGLLGLDPLDAAYQTVTTVSTVGFRELGNPSAPWKVFTMVLVLVGTGTVLYTVSALFELVIDERLTDRLGRRRMERDIAQIRDHVIVCGYGRVGQTIATYLDNARATVLVVDRDGDRLAGLHQPYVVGDATDDAVLTHAGIATASTLIAVADTDPANLYITLSARALRPDLFIIARARVSSAEPKLHQAGANRVVNPQLIGGARIAALTLQPHVAEFVDVVMHDGSLEFRLEEMDIPPGSAVAGRSLRDAHIRDRTGALVLAVRRADGSFVTNPDPDLAIDTGVVLITIGTREQLAALGALIRADPSTVGDD
jgi:voltage-gated potassium channel